MNNDPVEEPLEKYKRLLKLAYEALKQDMFIEQTKGGCNPYKEGTNKYAAFQLRRNALTELRNCIQIEEAIDYMEKNENNRI